MTDSPPADIFLSYAHEDKPLALRLTEYLRSHGWSVFWDHTIPVGRTWPDYIGVALQGCRCVVVMWSRHSITSNWVREEADEGLRRNILVPVLVQDDIAPPFGFRSIQAAKLTDWSGDPAHPGLETLINAVQRLASRDRSEPIKDASAVSAIATAATRANDRDAKTAWNRRAVLASTIGAGTLLAAGAAVKFWPKPSLPLTKAEPVMAEPLVAKTQPRRKRRGPHSVSSALSPGFYTNRRSSIIHRVLVTRKIGHVSFISEANLRPFADDAFGNLPSAKGLPHVHLTASSHAFEDAALDLVRRKDPEAAIDLLRVAIIHDLEIQKRSACKPSFRLYDLFAGLSIRHAKSAQLRSMAQDLADTPHALLFADRIAKWTNSNSRWYKGWSTRTNQKQWGGLPM